MSEDNTTPDEDQPDEIEEERSPELLAKLAVPVDEMPITYTTLEMLASLPTTPDRFKGKPKDMLAVVLVGRELGVKPMSSINNLYLVDGDVAMKGKLMSALVHRAGHQLRIKIKVSEVTASAHRRDPYTHKLEKVGEVTFGQDDAERAGLADKPAYENFPSIMWSWRAISALCRVYFSDVLEGVGYVPDDLGVVTPPEMIPDDIEIELSDSLIEDATLIDAVIESATDTLDAEQVPS